MRIVLLLVAAAALSGCAYLGSATDRFAAGVDTYCVGTQEERAIVRGRVNEALAEKGHSININCAGDQ